MLRSRLRSTQRSTARKPNAPSTSSRACLHILDPLISLGRRSKRLPSHKCCWISMASSRSRANVLTRCTTKWPMRWELRLHHRRTCGRRSQPKCLCSLSPSTASATGRAQATLSCSIVPFDLFRLEATCLVSSRHASHLASLPHLTWRVCIMYACGMCTCTHVRVWRGFVMVPSRFSGGARPA